MEVSVSNIDNETKKIKLLLRNDGFLPTYITALAKRDGLVNPTTLRVHCEDGVELMSGDAHQRIEHLDGIFNRNVPRHSGLSTSGATDNSKRELSFIVKGEGELRFEWFGDRIGFNTTTISLS